MTESQAVDVLIRLENIQELLMVFFYFFLCVGLFMLFATIFYFGKLFLLG